MKKKMAQKFPVAKAVKEKAKAKGKTVAEDFKEKANPQMKYKKKYK